jgi:hypothetical protein
VATAEEAKQMINFKSVGHFFATVFQKVVADIPKVEATAATVEKVTASVPVYGPLAVPIEEAGYALLGELASVLTTGGDAAKAKLADAGLDTNVIATVEELLASVPQFVALVRKL